MDLTRKQVIEILEKADSTVYKEPKTKTAYALEYAISSLKTDENYQIMYEGGEIFTKDEVIALLEEIKSDLSSLPIFGDDITMFIKRESAQKTIQQKIQVLKEQNNG